jgi:competence protein ComEC
MRLTKSKIFLLLLISFILGIFLGPYLPYKPGILLGIALAFLFIIILWWRKHIVKILALCSVILLTGVFRYNSTIPKIDEHSLQFYNEQEVKLQGIVCGEPDVRADKINLTIDSRQLTVDSRQLKVSGKVLLQLGRYPEYQYGDKLEISGKLKTPPELEDFSYKNYLARYGIYSLMYKPEVKLIGTREGNKFYTFILDIKNKFKQTINKILPEPQSSLLCALILGIKKGISSDLLDKFSQVGISHIIVISGMHMIIIVSILTKIFYNLAIPRKISFVIITFIILLFIVITGFGPAAIRAGILAFLVLFAQIVSRKRDSIIALLFVAFAMLLLNPKLLKDDVGFQLSFLATAGILYISPILEPKIKRLWLPVKSALIMTLSAQIFVLPWVWYKFGGVSLFSPLANILVVSVVPFAMGFGFAAAFLGVIFIPLGQVIGFIAWVFLSYILCVAKFFSSLSFAYLQIKGINIICIILYYIILAYTLFRYTRERKLRI